MKFFQDGILPGQEGASDLPLDWDHIYVTMESLLKRFPTLKEVPLEKLSNDPEPYSPDAEWVLGHAPEVRKIASRIRNC